MKQTRSILIRSDRIFARIRSASWMRTGDVFEYADRTFENVTTVGCGPCTRILQHAAMRKCGVPTCSLHKAKACTHLSMIRSQSSTGQSGSLA